MCNGKLDTNGTCDKCGKKSQTSSAFCTELMEYESPSEINYLQEEGSGTSEWNPWGSPYLINTFVHLKSIELIYRQDSNVSYTPEMRPVCEQIKIFKVIYSCKRGKWHVSDRIEGQYISAQDERYEF